MRELMENWRGLINDDEQQERVCLDREAFDVLMKRIADAYDDHLSKVIVEDEQKQKIINACAKNGLYSLSHFLRHLNAFELAQKGKLNTAQK
mgnify:CR=1 FL=1